MKIPPPIVGAACCALVWALDRALPTARIVTRWNDEIALALLIAGIGLAAAGAISFERADTTVDPLHPERSTALVTSGVFRITRNPMYVGMALGVAAFVVWIDRMQIPAEERALAAHFGPAFAAYRDRVRRWL
ncbi:MAG: isoprenylcysteine carboxylmethyltransferase family protein [Xanthomonadaceae bacterium]|nr:isoprenylcysteine carboxylmethyltransferase family protein [Xanthomonadaceae bacterium]